MPDIDPITTSHFSLEILPLEGHRTEVLHVHPQLFRQDLYELRENAVEPFVLFRWTHDLERPSVESKAWRTTVGEIP